MEVFSKYTKGHITYKKEAKIPPAELEEFKRVWKPDTPKACWECGKRLSEDITDHYCNGECKYASQRIVCVCGAPAMIRNGHKHCAVCKRGGHATPDASTSLGRNLKSSTEGLNTFQDFIFFRATINPDHEPAWKRRRGSKN